MPHHDILSMVLCNPVALPRKKIWRGEEKTNSTHGVDHWGGRMEQQICQWMQSEQTKRLFNLEVRLPVTWVCVKKYSHMKKSHGGARKRYKEEQPKIWRNRRRSYSCLVQWSIRPNPNSLRPKVTSFFTAFVGPDTHFVPWVAVHDSQRLQIQVFEDVQWALNIIFPRVCYAYLPLLFHGGWCV